MGRHFYQPSSKGNRKPRSREQAAQYYRSRTATSKPILKATERSRVQPRFRPWFLKKSSAERARHGVERTVARPDAQQRSSERQRKWQYAHRRKSCCSDGRHVLG